MNSGASASLTDLDDLYRALVDILAFVVQGNGGAAKAVGDQVLQVHIGHHNLLDVRGAFSRNAIAGKGKIRGGDIGSMGCPVDPDLQA